MIENKVLKTYSGGISQRIARFASCDSQLPLNADLSVTLYQYSICPYCNKVKAVLDALHVPYIAIEVDPLFKGELAFSKDYKKVPIALINGDAVNESGNIIRALCAARLTAEQQSTFIPADSDK
jgi:glutathione S-transferase